LSGRDAIGKLMTAFLGRGTCVELEIRHLAVDGNVVLMERSDHWILDGKKRAGR
jgi:limonene-1,2-epoxide hydrolase